MNCLVVGSSGYIGSTVAGALRAEGHETLLVGGRFTTGGQARYAYSEGLYTALQPELSSIDAVVYAAGRVVPSTNVTLTEAISLDVKPLSELLESLASSGRKPRFVFISSAGAVYGPAQPGVPLTEASALKPVSVYGLVRSMMEQLVSYSSRLGAIQGVSLRLSNVYGPGQRVNGPAAFVIRALTASVTGHPMELWGDGSQRKDFVFIEDVVAAVKSAFAALEAGRVSSNVFNICRGESISLRDVLRSIEQVSGRPVPHVIRPAHSTDVPLVELSPERAALELGWKAQISFAEGIARSLRQLG